MRVRPCVPIPWVPGRVKMYHGQDLARAVCRIRPPCGLCRCEYLCRDQRVLPEIELIVGEDIVLVWCVPLVFVL